MTNETLQTLSSRRSCRAFKPDTIPEETLMAVLEAGSYAPNGWDRQSASIVAIRDEAARQMLTHLSHELAMEAGEDTPDPLYGAPVIILVAADKDSETGIEDGTLVAGNIMNAAASVGLGSCWINTARKILEMPIGRAMMQKWGMEGTYIGVTFISLGWPAEEPGERRERKENFIRIV